MTGKSGYLLAGRWTSGPDAGQWRYIDEVVDQALAEMLHRALPRELEKRGCEVPDLRVASCVEVEPHELLTARVEMERLWQGVSECEICTDDAVELRRLVEEYKAVWARSAKRAAAPGGPVAKSPATTRRLAWRLSPLLSLAQSGSFRLSFEKPVGTTFSYCPHGSHSQSDGSYILHSTYEVYVPTDDDLDAVRRHFPQMDPEHPNWVAIEAELIARGHSRSDLRFMSAVAVLRLMDQSDAPAKPAPKSLGASDAKERRSDPMDHAQSVLYDVCRCARELATATEDLEAVYARVEGPINSAYFHVLSTMDTGRALVNPKEEDRIPAGERARRRDAIDAVLTLRAAVDEAVDSVKAVAPYMDSPHESADKWWTNRTIGELRVLRGAILRGHTFDVYPSALPMIRVGTPQALRDAARTIERRMEEVKTAIIAEVKPRRAPSDPPTERLNPQPGIVALDPKQVKLVAQEVARAALALRDTTENPTGHGRTNVVMWEGASPTERNIRLARTRTAYLEANGNATAAMESLRAGGNGLAKSTFYDHLNALDEECPGWRTSILLSGTSGIPESDEIAGIDGDTEEKVG